jgi:YfiH family protein
MPELILPDWPAPPAVRALVTTRALGDMKAPGSRARLRVQLPSDPVWLKQVHGIEVVDASCSPPGFMADASYARKRNTVCAVTIADCMPVLLADAAGEAVGIAHAGWRGLAAGVIEAALEAMALPPQRTLAWLGPAIGAGAYEVGEEVRAALLERDAGAQAAFSPGRPGRWQLDLYAAARRRLAARGVSRVWGGGFCTFAQADRFFSWRRERAAERMAAAIWLA